MITHQYKVWLYYRQPDGWRGSHTKTFPREPSTRDIYNFKLAVQNEYECGGLAVPEFFEYAVALITTIETVIQRGGLLQ